MIVVGSLAPSVGGTLAAIAGPLTIVGAGGKIRSPSTTPPTSSRKPQPSLPHAPHRRQPAGNHQLLAISPPLNVLLGSGSNNVTIAQTSSATSTVVNAGAGNNTITLTDDSGPTTVSSGAGNDSYTVTNTHGPTTINTGDGNDTIAVATTSASTSITTGNGTDNVAIANTGAATSVVTGNGADTITVNATGVATSVATGTGVDSITVGSLAPTLGGVLDNISGALTVTGGGATTLTLDDTGSVATKSLVLTNSSVTGLSPAAVNYSTLAALNVLRGSANTNATVNSTAAGTTSTIDTGSGNDAFTVAPASGATGGLPVALAGALIVDGGTGTNTLLVDDSTDTATESMALTATQISGLGGPVTYGHFATLSIDLSSTDTFTGSQINPGTVTNIDGGIMAATISGDLAGTLNLTSESGGSLAITGNLLGTLTVASSLTSLSVGGNLSGSASLVGSLGPLSITHDLSGSVLIGTSLGSGMIGGNLSGSLSAGTSIGTMGITGNLSGALSAGPTLGTLTLTGDSDRAGNPHHRRHHHLRLGRRQSRRHADCWRHRLIAGRHRQSLRRCRHHRRIDVADRQPERNIHRNDHNVERCRDGQHHRQLRRHAHRWRGAFLPHCRG